MRFPQTSPDYNAALTNFFSRLSDAGKERAATSIDRMTEARPVDAKGRYLHWDDLRFQPPPEGLSIEESWVLTRWARRRASRSTPFTDKENRPFSFVPTDFINRALHEIDSETRGGVKFTDATPTDSEARSFLVSSLLEEPFNSSLLEGAATTREQAKRLIRQHKPPATVGERMVLNNYRAIEFIKKQKNELLTVEIIHELHRLLTEGTLENLQKAGVFRSASDDVNVVDDISGEILHAPPAADALEARAQNISDFANRIGEAEGFIHPVLRAIILHFMLAYDHPYIDGNGRTARALFYWSVVKDGYWLLEYVSISRIINEAPTKYGMAFLHTETDDNDLTYFIIHQLTIIQKAIAELHEFIDRKQQELKRLSIVLGSRKLRSTLNHRQLALLHHAIRSPGAVYYISEHQALHGVSYLTARSDLEGLTRLGFLSKRKYGNKSVYRPVQKLTGNIAAAVKTPADVRSL